MMMSIRRTTLGMVVVVGMVWTSALRAQPAAATQATRPAPADLEAITTRLTLRPSAAARGPLKYKLLPDLADQAPGNAAMLYLRAREFWPDAQKTSELLYPEKQRYDYQDTPIDRFPRKYADALLAGYATTLNFVDVGARRREAVWDVGWRDAKLRAEQADQRLAGYLNALRHAENLLGFRASYRISQGDWDAAAYSLQTSFAVARHVAAEPSLLHGLVTSGFVQVSVYHGVEPWIARGGSPNLYWALADLPEPFADLRRVAEAERELPHRQPELARALRGDLPAERWPAALREMVETLRERQLPLKPEATVEAQVKALVESTHPRAKEALIEGGMTEEQVRAMSAEQAVGAYLCREYAAAVGEAWKGWALPYSQAEKQMRSAWKALAVDQPPLVENPLVQAELVRFLNGRPTYEAPQLLFGRFEIARGDRYVGLMRTIEAIRDYAARHDGRLPERLEQITELPLPIDPIIGRPFDYALKGELAILEAKAPAWRGFRSGWRYELRMGR